MRCFGDFFENTSTSMFLTMFFKTQNIVQTMHLTMLIAHPWALEGEFDKPYFADLSAFVTNERAMFFDRDSVLPRSEEVWSWTTRFPIEEVKVVIVGQDPSPKPGMASGLAFSSSKGVFPSLKNIYKELEDDVPGFQRPNHGYLGGWADQGVLLLNAVLTVREGRGQAN